MYDDLCFVEYANADKKGPGNKGITHGDEHPHHPDANALIKNRQRDHSGSSGHSSSSHSGGKKKAKKHHKGKHGGGKKKNKHHDGKKHHSPGKDHNRHH